MEYFDIYTNRGSGRYPKEFQDIPLDDAEDIFVGDLDPDGGGLFQNSFAGVDDLRPVGSGGGSGSGLGKYTMLALGAAAFSLWYLTRR